MNITIFGGSEISSDSTPYQEAYELGKLLAQAGHTVLTGGYMGSMEGVSRGANEAGGHVIGVTCADIEAWRGIKVNQWVKEERRCITLRERLNALIDGCEAAIALAGGPGTLAEITLTWNLMLIDPNLVKPLILVGPGWRAVFDEFFNAFSIYMPPAHRDLLKLAPTVEDAVKFIGR
jgi:uncharacterized protein (TIGR00725 family)